jgi:calcium permeable stress-gated cation channel
MLFWAMLAMIFFYMAYRYNVLFVTDTKVDTQGLIYPRALQQLFCGVYLAEICMIGMFVVSVAIGPLILMVIMLVVTVIFHITFNKAMNSLLYYLPRTLEIEEQTLSSTVTSEGVDNGHNNGTTADISKEVSASDADRPVKKQGNILTRFLKPWAFADYATLRELVPRGHIDFERMYTEDAQVNAYYPPAVISATPLLWIPEDEAGVSKQEIAHTSKVIPITDEGCTLDEKNKLVWDTETSRPPIWDEKVYY